MCVYALDANGANCESEAGFQGRCFEGQCVECLGAEDCDDQEICTQDRCQNQQCTHTPLQGDCDDGDPCSLDDRCDPSGQCRGTPQSCDTPPADQCIGEDAIYRQYLNPGQCNSNSGRCDYESIDQACAGCRQNCLEVCANVMCPEPTEACTRPGRCIVADPPSCVYDALNDGSSCDWHGQAGYCLNGTCGECWQDAVCDDGDPCTQDICGAGGLCQHNPQAGACNDGDPCTLADACDLDGLCQGTDKSCQSPPADLCLDNNTVFRHYQALGQCTQPNGDCLYPFVDQSCPSCRASCLRVCDSLNCDPSLGECLVNGHCVASDPPSCIYDPAPSGTVCHMDADTSGRCLDGNCVACLVDNDCDDGESCTVDTCLADRSCTHSPIDVGGCDDGDLCTDQDVCVAGVCLGQPRACTSPPADTCINGDTVFEQHSDVGTCNPATGLCDYTITQQACPDCLINCLQVCAGVVCNQANGGCLENGHCVPGSPPGCVYDDALDGKICVRSGGGLGVCFAAQCMDCLNDSDCDDRNDCTADSCGSDHRCTHDPLTGVDCDDGAACTHSDTCLAGHCIGQAYLCDDNNPCTRDICLGDGTCGVENFSKLYCDDGDDCTYYDRCSQGFCQGQRYSCDDGRVCTFEFCTGDGRCDRSWDMSCGAITDVLAVFVDYSTAAVKIGGTFELATEVDNIGLSETILDFDVALYLSQDTRFDSYDVRLARRTVPNLAAGANSSAVMVATVPASTTPTTYHIILVADDGDAVPEPDETNNVVLAAQTLEVTRDIDLVAATPSVAHSSIKVGERFNLNSSVTNQGSTMISSPFEVGFYLSADTRVDPGDTLLAYRYVNTLEPGATSTVPTNLLVPRDMEPGFYHLLVFADRRDVVREYDESNNLTWTPTFEVLRDVDLMMTTFTPPVGSFSNGESFFLYNEVSNLGTTMTAATLRVVFYLSTDVTMNSSDIELGSYWVPYLNAGQSLTQSTRLTVPRDTPPYAGYYLGAVVDADNAQVETNESNNTVATGVYEVVHNVDLVALSLSPVPAQLSAGDSYSFSSAVVNTGTTMTAHSVNVGLYLSSDATVTAADTALAQWSITVLEPGQTDATVRNVRVPASTAPGTDYYLGLIADVGDRESETDESNNVWAVGPVEVYFDVDLTIPAASTSATVFHVGDSIDYTYTLRNDGRSRTNRSYLTGIFLSTDAHYDVSDIQLTTNSGSNLAGQSEQQKGASLAIATSVPPGDYFLISFADMYNWQVESDETNNTHSLGPLTLLP